MLSIIIIKIIDRVFKYIYNNNKSSDRKWESSKKKFQICVQVVTVLLNYDCGPVANVPTP